MKRYRRIFVIVIDSLGIGPMDDSKEYGDIGVNTFKNVWNSQNGLNIPNLRRLGLGNLCDITNDDVMGYALKLKEASVGKDTMTGHWEMMGLRVTTPFKTFTENGFPEELIKELETKFGRKIVGNKSASGTEILEEYGEHEIETGDVIVYTSADSVLQICGHEEKMGLKNLYKYCEIAREVTMKPEWKVGRIIARPYIGNSKLDFKRTSNRHDYALKPYSKTVLDHLKENKLDVIGIGKINDIFDGQGITEYCTSISSEHGMEQTIEILDKDFNGLCFVNLVDFDALWGHRRDPKGYGEELEKFDKLLGTVLKKLNDDDLLFITADHGNDPTYIGTDHTREMVPLLIYSPHMTSNGLIETGDTFANIGATILDNFELEILDNSMGQSLLNRLK